MTKLKNPETIALHGGDYRSDPATTAVAVPLYRTTSSVSYTHLRAHET